MVSVVKIIVLLGFVSLPLSLHARSQALLIGVAQYPGDMALEGPVNDVELIRELLVQSEHFGEENISELINERATKSNIVKALNNLRETTERGDKVVIYFSGHGTSAMDNKIQADIPPNTGALVPFDISTVSSRKQLNERLLVGSRDLRPVLSDLDKAGVEILVLVDACYSGNVVRGKKNVGPLPFKFMDFSELLIKLSLRNKSTELESTSANTPELIETNSYPYRNVFMISAANEGQTAQDIPSNWLGQFPTVDSKPHGAFTDSLVRALTGLYADSKANNTKTTLTDLHSATTRLMKERKFLSRPRLLPEDHDRTEAIALQRFFGKTFGLE